MTKVLTDGAGRSLITIDAAGNVSTVQMDNVSSVLKSRDANDVVSSVAYALPGDGLSDHAKSVVLASETG